MKYIALLRGINISGKNKIVMSKLKEVLEKNNYQNEINNLIDKIKKDNNDVLGIENYIYKHDKNYNKNNFKLNNIKNKNNIEFNIISTGEIRKWEIKMKK